MRLHTLLAKLQVRPLAAIVLALPIAGGAALAQSQVQPAYPSQPQQSASQPFSPQQGFGSASSPVQQQQSIFGGRAGTTATRAPLNQLKPTTQPVISIKPVVEQPAVLEPANLPRYGDLELPLQEEEEGPPDGLTLDKAIDRMVSSNLNLLSLKFELPMAEADMLTASLRNNPIFYADAQLVPYGHYSNARPGGQTQYDVNVTQPIDVWRKRKARMIVAQRAKRVTEAQFQDAVRNSIDNLYTAYVDAVAAKLTLRFSEKYHQGLKFLLANQKDGMVLRSTVAVCP